MSHGCCVIVSYFLEFFHILYLCSVSVFVLISSPLLRTYITCSFLTLSMLRHISKQEVLKQESSSSSCMRVCCVNIHVLMSNYSTRKVFKSDSSILEARIYDVHVSCLDKATNFKVNNPIKF